MFLVEANYEFEHLGNTDGGYRLKSPPAGILDHAGAARRSTVPERIYLAVSVGWRDKLDSPGVGELSFMKKLFATRRWYALVRARST